MWSPGTRSWKIQSLFFFPKCFLSDMCIGVTGRSHFTAICDSLHIGRVSDYIAAEDCSLPIGFATQLGSYCGDLWLPFQTASWVPETGRVYQMAVVYVPLRWKILIQSYQVNAHGFNMFMSRGCTRDTIEACTPPRPTPTTNNMSCPNDIQQQPTIGYRRLFWTTKHECFWGSGLIELQATHSGWQLASYLLGHLLSFTGTYSINYHLVNRAAQSRHTYT